MSMIIDNYNWRWIKWSCNLHIWSQMKLQTGFLRVVIGENEEFECKQFTQWYISPVALLILIIIIDRGSLFFYRFWFTKYFIHSFSVRLWNIVCRDLNIFINIEVVWGYNEIQLQCFMEVGGAKDLLTCLTLWLVDLRAQHLG